MTYKVTWRDRLAYHAATFALTWIATPEYGAFIGTLTRRGHRALIEELEMVERA